MKMMEQGMPRGWATRRLTRQGLTWRVADHQAGALAEWLDRYFPVRPDSPVRFLQAAPNRFVAAAGGYVLKESGPRPGRGRLAYGLRPPAARLIVRRSLALLACGIPTHEPVAWAVRRERGLRVRDYVITREIADTEVMTRRLDRCRNDGPGRDAVLRAWGGVVAALHRNRFGNRDLKDANILVSLSSPPRLWVTDLEGLRRFPWLPARIAAADLKPVALSLRCHGWLREKTDEAAFFSAYNAGVPERLRRGSFPG
jgi:hypothetical protein